MPEHKSIRIACAVISPFAISCTGRFRCVYKPLPPFNVHEMRSPVETAAESISLGALLPTAEVPPLQCNFQHLTRIRRSAQYKGFPQLLFSLCNGSIIVNSHCYARSGSSLGRGSPAKVKAAKGSRPY